MKRRSVLQAGLYGQRRISSIKRKQAEGVCLLSDIVDSPSAQQNGVFDFEAGKKEVAQVDPNQKKGKLAPTRFRARGQGRCL